MSTGNGKPAEHHLLNGTPRTGSRQSLPRSLVTIVGIVVLLIAAIAYANRSDNASERPGGAESSKSSGYANTRHGVKQAATAYAADLGGEDMFSKESRDRLVEAVVAPDAQGTLREGFDADYSEGLAEKVGLTPEGKAPKGATFISRTMPAGVRVNDYQGTEAAVNVWCSGLLGITGEDSKNPVRTTWFTMTMKLKWTQDDWKLSEFTQKQGPTPKSGSGSSSDVEDVDKTVDTYEVP